MTFSGGIEMEHRLEMSSQGHHCFSTSADNKMWNQWERNFHSKQVLNIYLTYFPDIYIYEHMNMAKKTYNLLL